MTVATSGVQLDPDGYSMTLDDATPTTVAANGAVTLESISPGSHSLVFTGLACNCSTSTTTVNATVTAGATSNVQFRVACNSSTDAPATHAITLPADVTPEHVIKADSQLWIGGESSLPSPLLNQLALSIVNVDADAPTLTARFGASAHSYRNAQVARSASGDAIFLSDGYNGANAIYLTRVSGPVQTSTPATSYALLISSGSTLGRALQLILAPQPMVLYQRMGLTPPPRTYMGRRRDDGSSELGFEIEPEASATLGLMGVALASAGSSSLLGVTKREATPALVVATRFVPHDPLAALGPANPIASGSGVSPTGGLWLDWCRDQYVMAWWVTNDSGEFGLRGITLDINGQPTQSTVTIGAPVAAGSGSAFAGFSCDGDLVVIAYTDSPSNIRYITTDRALVQTGSRNIPLPTGIAGRLEVIPFPAEVVVAFNDSPATKRLARVCRN